MTTQKRIVTVIAISFLILGTLLTVLWMNFLRTPLITDDAGFKYNVRLGASYKTMAADLHDQHVLKSPFFFTLLFRFEGNTHALKAGEYLFPKGTTPLTMIDQVVTGRGMVNHSFIILPGNTFHQLRMSLNNDLEIQHTTKNLSDAAIMKRLGSTEKPEGQFFPDTYYFVQGSSDIILLKRAYIAMQKKLGNAWLHRANDLPFQTPYQALTAASIIEKEADIKEELPIIAGVLVNRLRRDIKLQFDPTVIYGLGSRFNGTIYRRDLIENTPFNTYVHKGLTPTPISMPSMESIDAVMHPDRNNYLYFVARGDGATHQFSRTLVEHYAAVAAAKKKFHPWIVNTSLIKQYLLKTSTQKIFNTN